MTDQVLTLDWVTHFLTVCNQIARATAILDAALTGRRQFAQQGLQHYASWRTGAARMTEERERSDFDWWSAHLARQTNAVLHCPLRCQ